MIIYSVANPSSPGAPGADGLANRPTALAGARRQPIWRQLSGPRLLTPAIKIKDETAPGFGVAPATPEEPAYDRLAWN